MTHIVDDITFSIIRKDKNSDEEETLILFDNIDQLKEMWDNAHEKYELLDGEYLTVVQRHVQVTTTDITETVKNMRVGYVHSDS